MGRFLLRRLAACLTLVWLVLTGTFFLLHLAPGGPGGALEDPRIPSEQRLRLRELWGLDRPLAVQYGLFLTAAARGEWGHSFQHHRPVAAVVAGALPPTLLLAGAALAIEWTLGLALGVAAARRPGGALDQTLRILSLVLYSLPTFWLGLMAVLLFSFHWPLFPPSHLASVGAEALPPLPRLADLAWHLALPALAVGLPSAAALARFVRGSLVETLGQEFVLAARARGLSGRRVLFGHALRASLAPLSQLFGLSLAFLLSGTLAVEVVFAWPGIGRVTFDALTARDYPVVLATTALSATMVVLGSLAADLLLAWADPRVRRA
ncbi:MAG: ABC transporter permease [Thermoanaerobaculia bacterium]|nr:ABC transporter permease [Thermoanaerobaculia bacterium]MCZ7649901.1 ABC transporter permease [Thermoanaerobaculia bacterium]